MKLPTELMPHLSHRTWKKPRQAHTTPTPVVLMGMTGQLERHVGPHWTAAVIFSDCRGVTLTADPSVKLPPRRACEWMESTVYLLNLRINHGGHWVVAWTIGGEPVLLWRDGDGDPHVAIEIAAGANNLHLWGIDRVEAQAEEGWHRAHELVSQMDLAKRQQVKLAAGETPTAP